MGAPAAGLIGEMQSLAKSLQADLSIAELEESEAKLKFAIRELVEKYQDDPSCAFAIAEAQKDMGLLRKYKSYGIKACTPLGYAIFLLEPWEGFSFQNHLTGKVELFHFLRVSKGGYAFVSSEDDWNRTYEKEKFQDWLDGKKDPAYDRFKISVRAGDVVKIDKSGMVHTAIGCVLEEYATASTDMVERLHDQNAGKSIPKKFSKAFVGRALKKIRFPAISSKTVFGSAAILHRSKEFVAGRFEIGGRKSQMIRPGDHYASLYITKGNGKISIQKFTLNLRKGDSILLVPGTRWNLKNISRIPLGYSFLSVHRNYALK